MQKSAQLDFGDLPGNSRLFLDFLSGKANSHYRHHYQQSEGYAELQQALTSRRFDRLTLIETLTRQNSVFGAGQETFDNIKKLGKPQTLAVVAGQQVTLFGGSILTFYKAAVAVKLAESNCRELQTDVVPIFWMAADDADFEEVADVVLPAVKDELETLKYRPRADVSGLPMASVILDDNIAEMLDRYHALLPDTEFRNSLISRLREFYAPGQTVVTAFGRFLTWLFRGRGLILVDPSDPQLRKMAQPIYRREIELREKSSQAIAQQNKALSDAGYHLQVTRPPEYTNLFYEDRKRLRIDMTGEGFRIEANEYSREEMASLVESHPESFSPNVFLRPIVQSYLFPTLVHFVGPAEVAYIAQIKELYGLFDVPPPVIYPRFSGTIVESKVARVLEKYELSVVQLAADIDEVINELMRRLLPADLEQRFVAERSEIKSRLTGLMELLDQSDQGLIATANKSIGKVDYEIRGFQQKVFQAHKKSNQTLRHQIERAALHLFPDGKLQEKVFPLNYYLARYGDGVVDFLYDAVVCNTGVHHLIDMKGH